LSKKIADFLKPILAEILHEIQSLSGCQSVGIRLHHDGDYPYYVYEGFPNFFILKENSLCTRDEKGNTLRDNDGALLECMCGNVIEGRFDPKFSYFTEKGSFWTNSTTQFLDSVTETEWKILGRIRNMCHHSGYESVALLPLRVGNRTLGLIQLNDPRENMFTLEKLEKYEALADHVGTVVYNAFEIQERITSFINLINEFKSVEE
jgi:hypothetical protein